MKTVKEMSQITGVSIRTLRYYDEIGLLKPTEYTQAGYRLYDSKALEKLQEIMLMQGVFCLICQKNICRMQNWQRLRTVSLEQVVQNMQQMRLSVTMEYKCSITCNRRIAGAQSAEQSVGIMGSKYLLPQHHSIRYDTKQTVLRLSVLFMLLHP